MTIFEMNPLNLMNKLCGNDQDKGVIDLYLLPDNCIYFDCYSTVSRSKSWTPSQANLFSDEIALEDYEFEYYETDYIDATQSFLLAEGSSNKDSSKLRIYVHVE